MLERRREHLLERLRRAAQAKQRRRAHLRRLEDHQVRAVPVRANRLPQLAERRLQAILRPAARRAVGRADAARPACRDHVIRRQKALLLVRELLVERAPRHARQADHLLHARALVSVGRDGLDHRAVHARALVADDLLRTEPMRSMR